MLSRLCALMLTLALLPTGGAHADAPAAGFAPGATFTLLTRRPGGRDSLTTLELRSFLDIPDARDMCVSVMDELLVLGGTGRLHRLEPGGAAPDPFDGDIDPRARIEAVAAEGGDWLLLVDRGRSIQRLGARGQDLGAVATPGDGDWEAISSDGSGRIRVLDRRAGLLAALSAGGQSLGSWSLRRTVPNYRGPLATWAADGQGGLFFMETGGRSVLHLSASGGVGEPPRTGPLNPGALLAWSRDAGLCVLVDGGCPEGSKLLVQGDRFLLLREGRVAVLHPADPARR